MARNLAMRWAGNWHPAYDENEGLIIWVYVLMRSLVRNLVMEWAGNRCPACDGYEDYRIKIFFVFMRSLAQNWAMECMDFPDFSGFLKMKKCDFIYDLTGSFAHILSTEWAED